MRYCNSCGKQIEDGIVCDECYGKMQTNKTSGKTSDKRKTFVSIIALMGIMLFCVVFFPVIEFDRSIQWFLEDTELEDLSIWSLISLKDRAEDSVFLGVLVFTMTMCVISAAGTLWGAFRQKCKICLVFSGISFCVAVYFLCCFCAEFGVDMAFGSDAILSVGFWAGMIAHAIVLFICLIFTDTNK